MATVSFFRRLTAGLVTASVAGVALYASACASGSSGGGASASSPAPAGNITMSPNKPSPDPRIGLAPGTTKQYPFDTTRRQLVTKAKEAEWNMHLVKNMPPTDSFIGVTHSDIAFRGNYVIQGNYDGYDVWDVTNPRNPTLYHSVVCRGSQSDVSVYGNFIFESGEAVTGRNDCSKRGIPQTDSISMERFRGVRIFDATDLKNPKLLKNVQTCRGSHTHTVVADPKDKANVYIYVSGSAGVRSPKELAGCSDLDPSVDPTSELFKIEVIQIPLANPSAARVISKPPILADLTTAPRGNARAAQDSTENAQRAAALAASGRGGRAGGGGGRGRGAINPALVGKGPQQCHDITVYPDVGMAGGACGGYGVLLDITNPAQPKRLFAAADSNMQFWHSATFNNDGTKILFSDEWGGGSAPRCRSTDHYEWGSDALFTIEKDKKLSFKSYYKMPAAQTQNENCVAHNGSLIPIPGRDVMVQSWYQGGVSIFDWSDASHPKEIAFQDRGPYDVTGAGANAGTWSVYWYNGYMYSSEIGRGLDIFELQPSAFISQNEIDAAKSVHYDYLNVQGQQKMVWPPSFSLSRAYTDQLERSGGYAAAKIASIRADLAAAEKLTGQARKDMLTKMATALHTDARASSDATHAHALAFSVGDLGK